MAITIHSEATGKGQGAFGDTFSISKPSSVSDNDYLVAVVGMSNDTPALAPPIDWTTGDIVAGSSGTDLQLGIFYKKITSAAGEPTSYTFTAGFVDSICYWIGALTGVDLTTPEDETMSGNAAYRVNDTSPTASSITTATNGAFVLAGWFTCVDVIGTTLPGGSWDTRVDDLNQNSNQLNVVSQTFSSNGATGNVDLTDVSSSAETGAGQWAFRPATSTSPSASVSPSSSASRSLSPSASRSPSTSLSPSSSLSASRSPSSSASPSIGSSISPSSSSSASLSPSSSVSPSSSISSSVSPSPSPGTYNLIETLQDDFNDNIEDTGKWGGSYDSSATRAETGGELVITLASHINSNYSAYYSSNPYDLTDSYAFVQVNTMCDVSTNAQAFLSLQTTGNHNNVRFIQENGTLYAQHIIADVTTTVGSASYNSTTHKWWRIRESGGTVYWEYSSDGVSWSELISETTPIAIYALYAQIGGGTYQLEVNPGTVHFDNFNTLGSQGNFFLMFDGP